MKIIGHVRGTVRFPDHPERQGIWGLIGGEDVYARRETFRSIGEAMTWCRMVLDGTLTPRWQADGELLTPRTEPQWSEAEVSLVDRHLDTHVAYWTSDGRRTWHKMLPGDRHEIEAARTDWP